MSQPTLTVCFDCIDKVYSALTIKGLSRNKLADKLDVASSTINKFFKGKAIKAEIFCKICSELGLDVEEITGKKQVSEKLAQQKREPLNETINIDELVQTVRENIGAYTEERCGTMRVLDMTQPIGLDDIYTSVNILEKITGRIRAASIEEMITNVSREDVERFSLGRVREERVPGLEAVAQYSKLMILGKPGAGKTTFLKHLALLCIRGKFQEDRIPLFITLKDFAEAPNQPNLLTYLSQILVKYVSINTETDIDPIEQLLKQGKLLVLLDGLDEVQKASSKRVLKQIEEFTNNWSANQFVITCRIAAKEYTFEQFTEVEVADFNDEQIKSFSNKWFTAKNDTVKATKFAKKLQDDKPIRELASNPLLLTLLCLVFEESAEFPKNRSELYKEGLDVLLKKWDGKRNIEREQIYKKLSLKRKEDLLSQVAYSTFEQGQYFFKQKEVEARIIEYICNLPGCSDDPEVLQLDSEALLKSIEAQHGLFVERARGIYSFSHLTFHEYFTARKIKEAGNDKFLHILATRITEKRWREVFLLMVGMLDNADSLLIFMKQQIDSLLKGDEKLQQLLSWVEEKSKTVTAPYKPFLVRAYYLNLAHSQYLVLDRDLPFDLDLDFALDRDLALVLVIDRDIGRGFAFNFSQCLDFAFDFARYLDLVEYRDCEDELKRKLLSLKNELPNQTQDLDIFKQWWIVDSISWINRLRTVMIKHRNIGHDWQFTDSQKELLKKYYYANQLLIDCLNSDCYVSRDVRKYIEDTLLLPIKSIPPARL